MAEVALKQAPPQGPDTEAFLSRTSFTPAGPTQLGSYLKNRALNAVWRRFLSILHVLSPVYGNTPAASARKWSHVPRSGRTQSGMRMARLPGVLFVCFFPYGGDPTPAPASDRTVRDMGDLTHEIHGRNGGADRVREGIRSPRWCRAPAS